MPTKLPTFTKTMQLGIVVPNLEAAVRAYEEHYGIGPWEFMEIGPENAENVLVDGKPAAWHSRIAMTMIGDVMWELIEPRDEDDMFGKFLAQRGGIGGVHHVAVRTPDFQQTLADQQARGGQSTLSGTFAGIEVHYLDSAPDIGVILEVFSGMPGERA
jgi:methylmalonyl-CoA/ethylmalonyl-CoA epimerase